MKYFVFLYVLAEALANYVTLPGLGVPLKYLFFLPIFLSAMREFVYRMDRALMPVVACYIGLFLYGVGLHVFRAAESGWLLQLSLSHLFPMVALLSIAGLASRSPKLLKTFAVTYLGAICFTSAVSFMQYLGLDLAWNVRIFLEQFSSEQAELVQAHLENRVRAPGLSYFAVHLGYQAVLAAILASALNVSNLLSRERLWCIWGILLLGAFASQTKSSALAIFCVCLGHLFVFNREIFKRGLLVVFGLTISYLIYDSLSQEAQLQIFRLDESARTKTLLIEMGVLVFFNNPFGVLPGEYLDIASYYAVDFIGEDRWQMVLSATPHNYFVNMAVFYGFFGFACALVMVALPVRIIRDVRMRKVMVWIFPAYYVYGLVHNNGPLFSDHLFPIFFACLYALDRYLVEVRKRVDVQEDIRFGLAAAA